MHNSLLGRDKEAAILGEMLTSEKAEFLALYGRRRVGKTYLIRHFFFDKPLIFFNTTGSKKAPLKEQLGHFSKKLAEIFYADMPLKLPVSWNEAFEMLTDAVKKSPKDTKIVLFFDEFPWMATRNSRLLESLDYYWNQYWSDDARIKLIICGSSASWIIKKIIKNRAGLHNRITRRIRLEPFKLKEVKQFLSSRGINLNNRQVLIIYMAMGGIPYYLSQIPRGLSASQIIEQLAFSRDSFLLNEFDNLFPSLFDNYETYVDILRMLGNSRQGVAVTDILSALGKSENGEQGLQKLMELEESGFIKAFKSHFHKRKGKFYRLIDEYSAFYFTWIEPIKDSLQEDILHEGSWQALQLSPKWHSWLGYAFESVCYKHLSIIMDRLKVTPGALANVWRYIPKKGSESRGAQIDLLFDRLDNTITLCEIKYSDKAYVIDKDYANNLKNKRAVFLHQTKTKKQVFMAMIVAGGLKENDYSRELITAVMELDDFF